MRLLSLDPAHVQDHPLRVPGHPVRAADRRHVVQVRVCRRDHTPRRPDGTDSIDLHVEGDSGLTMHLGMLALTHDTIIRASMTDDLDSDE